VPRSPAALIPPKPPFRPSPASFLCPQVSLKPTSDRRQIQSRIPSISALGCSSLSLSLPGSIEFLLDRIGEHFRHSHLCSSVCQGIRAHMRFEGTHIVSPHQSAHCEVGDWSDPCRVEKSAPLQCHILVHRSGNNCGALWIRTEHTIRKHLKFQLIIWWKSLFLRSLNPIPDLILIDRSNSWI
jgi:hypothetical protein